MSCASASAQEENLLNGLEKQPNMALSWHIAVNLNMRPHAQLQGETSRGEGLLFEKLQIASEQWVANCNGIAAVLATPLLLEYKMETLDYAILGVIGILTAVSIAVPFVIPGAVAATAVACCLRSIPGMCLIGSLLTKACGEDSS